ncbi:hypothetical protein [Nesterenkonia sp. F]|uniref:hypothetical protein n=1 Tax=Nesterenkonia sp. F TaxID=795955 RepID=UPI0002FA43C1|nr:hypothetical protein [Nesterenkonia sp. F]
MSRSSRPIVATRDMVRRRRRRRAVAVLAVLAVLVGGTGYGAWRYIDEQEYLLDPGCTVPLGAQEHHLDPEQSAHAALVAAMSADRGLPVEAAVDALAISLKESELRVSPGGEDRPARALFRDSGPDWTDRQQQVQVLAPVSGFYDSLVEAREREKRSWTPQLDVQQAADVLDRPLDPSVYDEQIDPARAFAPPLTGRQPLGVACEFSRQDVPAADPQGMDAQMSAVLGRILDLPGGDDRDDSEEQVIRREDGADGATRLVVEISETDEQPALDRAWLVGQWAVATADVHGVWSVQAAGYQWRRETGRWEQLEEDASGDDAGQDAGPRTVRIGFTPRD